MVYTTPMQVQFIQIGGENTVCMVPETHAELRALLAEHEHEAYCPDCETTLDDCGQNVCSCCGEGIGMEPEFVKTRPCEPR